MAGTIVSHNDTQESQELHSRMSREGVAAALCCTHDDVQRGREAGKGVASSVMLHT